MSPFAKVRGFVGRNRKPGLAVIALIVAVELVAAAAVAMAGKELIEVGSAPAERGTPLLGLSSSAPPVTVF